MYIGSSRLFEWLRKQFGIESPDSLSSGGWDLWHQTLKKNKPVGYFVTETIPDALQWVNERTIEKVHNARYYLVQRFVAKSHVIDTGLPKGVVSEYHDLVLHGVFESLVNFVEVECASVNMYHATEAERKEFKYPWWMRHRIARLKPWRSPEAGVAYLTWSMSLDDPESGAEHLVPHQAETARNVFNLYKWWKYDRPSRPDPSVTAGLDEFFKAQDNNAGFLREFNSPEYARLRALTDKLEKDYQNEDDEMLMQLVTIRRSLWV
jgi:hypothetical protein